jgi:hypothetical protein
MLRGTHLAVLGLALGLPIGAQAEQFTFLFPLSAAQEVQTPAVNSPGTGTGQVMYDTDTNVIDWSVSFQDLVSNVSMAHFHGPAPAGQNATIILGVPTTPVMSGLLDGSGAWPEAQEQALLDGLVYFNIHTGTFGAGEIRGQVVPEPAAAVLVLAGAAALLARRARASRQ